MLSLGSAMAAASTWSGSINTDWSNAGNWSAGVPTNTLDANFPGGSTCVITNAAICSRIRCGFGGTASDISLTIQDSGKLDILANPWFGQDTAGTGYTVTVTQNNPGLTNTYSGSPRLAYYAGYEVLYNLQAGTLYCGGGLRVAGGANSKAQIHVSGGMLTGDSDLRLSDADGADATLKVSGGTVDFGTKWLRVDADATQTVHVVGADATEISFDRIVADSGQATFKFELENAYGNSGADNITPIHALAFQVDIENAQIQIIAGTGFECAVDDTFDLVIQDDGTKTFTAPNLTPDLSEADSYEFSLAVVEGASDILRATCTYAKTARGTVVSIK